MICICTCQVLRVILTEKPWKLIFPFGTVSESTFKPSLERRGLFLEIPSEPLLSLEIGSQTDFPVCLPPWLSPLIPGQDSNNLDSRMGLARPEALGSLATCSGILHGMEKQAFRFWAQGSLTLINSLQAAPHFL